MGAQMECQGRERGTMNATVIHYSHPKLIKPALYDLCLNNLHDVAPFPIVSIVCGEDEPRTPQNMFRTILQGLEQCDTEYVFLAEHDVLYAQGHFLGPESLQQRFTAVYDMHVWTLDGKTSWPNGRMICAGLCANRQQLEAETKHRIAHMDAGHKYVWSEPYRNVAAKYTGYCPIIDIRHGHNLTGPRKPAVVCRTYPPCHDKALIDAARNIINGE